MMNRAVRNVRVALWGLQGAVCVIASSIYGGPLLDYVLFTLCAALMLDIGAFKSRAYGVIVLAWFIWLGVWMKVSLHLLIGYPYIEPHGAFHFYGYQYSELLRVSAVGMLGFAVAFWLASRYRAFVRERGQVPASVRSWVPRAVTWAWCGLLLALVALGAVNAQMHIFRVGLPPDVVLPYPGNALISWLISTGFALGVAVLLNFSMMSRSHFKLGIAIVILEGAIVSISILSRASYVFHLLPVFIVLAHMHFTKHRLFSHRTALAICALAAVGTFVTATVVNVQREIAYADHPYSGEVDPETSAIIAAIKSQSFMKRAAVTFSQLVADRWVGTEGVMTAVADDDKSVAVLKRLLLEPRSTDTVSEYQRISGSHYKDMDTKRFQFAALPGPIGFFYLSGVSWIVFVGCCVLGLMVLLTERVTDWLTENPFLMAFMGVYVANLVAQFGMAPRQNLIPLAMNFAALGGIAVLQSFVCDRGCVARWRRRLAKSSVAMQS